MHLLVLVSSLPLWFAFFLFGPTTRLFLPPLNLIYITTLQLFLRGMLLILGPAANDYEIATLVLLARGDEM